MMDEDKIKQQLRLVKFELFEIKYCEKNIYTDRLKSNLVKDFMENNIEFDGKINEVFDLVDCVAYCWPFCDKYDILYFITLFWLHTILMDEVIYKNQQGIVYFIIYN